MAESWYKGQELGKGSVFIFKKTYKEQGRLELLLKQKLMESFLEMKHMLLNNYSNGFAPRSCLLGEQAATRLGSVEALIPGQLCAATPVRLSIPGCGRAVPHRSPICTCCRLCVNDFSSTAGTLPVLPSPPFCTRDCLGAAHLCIAMQNCFKRLFTNTKDLFIAEITAPFKTDCQVLHFS